jgi:hypothetical protein
VLKNRLAIFPTKPSHLNKLPGSDPVCMLYKSRLGSPFLRLENPLEELASPQRTRNPGT